MNDRRDFATTAIVPDVLPFVLPISWASRRPRPRRAQPRVVGLGRAQPGVIALGQGQLWLGRPCLSYRWSCGRRLLAGSSIHTMETNHVMVKHLH
jgi:hypothetical protein